MEQLKKNFSVSLCGEFLSSNASTLSSIVITNVKIPAPSQFVYSIAGVSLRNVSLGISYDVVVELNAMQSIANAGPGAGIGDVAINGGVTYSTIETIEQPLVVVFPLSQQFQEIILPFNKLINKPFTVSIVPCNGAGTSTPIAVGLAQNIQWTCYLNCVILD